MPNIAFKNRKQVHITSHVNGSPWLTKVAGIKNSKNKQAFHVVSQVFKCSGHSALPTTTCPCLGVYCPQYIQVNTELRELMNMVYPRGFESEVTGSSVSDSEIKSDTLTPFTGEVLATFMTNRFNKTDFSFQINKVVIGFDPTYAGGSKSCTGICTMIELTSGHMVVVGVDEMEIGELAGGVSMANVSLIIAHIVGLGGLFNIPWHKTPIVIIPEENSYVNAIEELIPIVTARAKELNFNVFFYYRWDSGKTKYSVGKHVGKNKCDLVYKILNGMISEKIGYYDTVYSFGDQILGSARAKVIEKLKTHNTDININQNLDPNFYANTGAPLPDQIMNMYLSGSGYDIFAVMDTDIMRQENIMKGTEMLKKLRDELSMITITKTQTGMNKVVTGGKRSEGGKYTRDDLFAAFLVGYGGNMDIFPSNTNVEIK